MGLQINLPLLLGLLGVLLTVGGGAIKWLLTQHQQQQAVNAKDLLDLRTRVAKLEADIRQVPSQQQLHEMVLQISRAAASTEALTQRVDALGRATNRIEDFLLNSK